eukprot:1627913-Amphidinium_carterae.1
MAQELKRFFGVPACDACLNFRYPGVVPLAFVPPERALEHTCSMFDAFLDAPLERGKALQ